MPIKDMTVANDQLGRCNSFLEIIESEHGQASLNVPGWLESMQKQAAAVGEVLPAKYLPAPTAAK